MANPKFLQKLIDGDIYDYSKSPDENSIQEMALAGQQVGTPSVPFSPLKLDFTDGDVILGDVAQPADIKPELPFAFKNKPLAQSMKTAEAPAAQQSPLPSKNYEQDIRDSLAKLNQDKMDDLSDATARKDALMQNALWLDAANTIGNAISRKAPNDVTKGLRDYATQVLDNAATVRKAKIENQDQTMQREKHTIDKEKAIFELGDKKAENDPNSDVSKAYREYMKSYIQQAGVGIKVDDNLSMADLQKQMGTLGNIIATKMANDARRDNLMLARENKAADAAHKNDIKNLDFAERQHDRIIKSTPYKSLQNAEAQSELVKSAIANPSGVKDIAALYGVVKGFDPESAVREGEISLAQQASSLKQRLELQISKLGVKPRVLPAQFLKEIQTLMEINKSVATKAYKRQINGILQNAKRRGMSDADMNMIDPIGISQQNTSNVQVKSDDDEAIAWAKQNPNDPRAAKILKANGVK